MSTLNKVQLKEVAPLLCLFSLELQVVNSTRHPSFFSYSSGSADQQVLYCRVCVSPPTLMDSCCTLVFQALI